MPAILHVKGFEGESKFLNGTWIQVWRTVNGHSSYRKQDCEFHLIRSSSRSWVFNEYDDEDWGIETRAAALIEASEPHLVPSGGWVSLVSVEGARSTPKSQPKVVVSVLQDEPNYDAKPAPLPPVRPLEVVVLSGFTGKLSVLNGEFEEGRGLVNEHKFFKKKTRDSSGTRATQTVYLVWKKGAWRLSEGPFLPSSWAVCTSEARHPCEISSSEKWIGKETGKKLEGVTVTSGEKSKKPPGVKKAGGAGGSFPDRILFSGLEGVFLTDLNGGWVRERKGREGNPVYRKDDERSRRLLLTKNSSSATWEVITETQNGKESKALLRLKKGDPWASSRTDWKLLVHTGGKVTEGDSPSKLKIETFDPLTHSCVGCKSSMRFCSRVTGADAGFATDGEWVDPDFPPNRVSLGFLDEIQTTDWFRVNLPVRHDDPGPWEVCQRSGEGGAWLTGALTAVSENPVLMQRCLPEGSQKDILKVRLCHPTTREWRDLELDNFLPCHPLKWWHSAFKTVDPLFVHPNPLKFGTGTWRDRERVQNPGAWACVVEKGVAKLLGSYAALRKDFGGTNFALNVAIGCSMLTGMTTYKVLQKDEAENVFNEHTVDLTQMTPGEDWEALMSRPHRLRDATAGPPAPPAGPPRGREVLAGFFLTRRLYSDVPMSPPQLRARYGTHTLRPICTVVPPDRPPVVSLMLPWKETSLFSVLRSASARRQMISAAICRPSRAGAYAEMGLVSGVVYNLIEITELDPPIGRVVRLRCPTITLDDPRAWTHWKGKFSHNWEGWSKHPEVKKVLQVGGFQRKGVDLRGLTFFLMPWDDFVAFFDTLWVCEDLSMDAETVAAALADAQNGADEEEEKEKEVPVGAPEKGSQVAQPKQEGEVADKEKKGEESDEKPKASTETVKKLEEEPAEGSSATREAEKEKKAEPKENRESSPPPESKEEKETSQDSAAAAKTEKEKEKKEKTEPENNKADGTEKEETPQASS